MIVEHRCYRLHPGKVPEYLALFELPDVLPRLLRNLRGFWIAESGMLNCVHHLWSYPNREERAAARQDMAADQAMRPFMTAALPLLHEQHSRVLAGTMASPDPGSTGGVFDLLTLAGGPQAKDRLANLAKALRMKAGIVASLRGSVLEGDTLVTSALFVLRHGSFAARERIAPQTEDLLAAARDDGWLLEASSQVILPAPFSPWQ